MNLEKSLKKFLKKKINVTAGMLISFLITGNIIYANNSQTSTITVKAKLMDKYINCYQVSKNEIPFFLEIKKNKGELKLKLNNYNGLNKPFIKLGLDKNNKMFKSNNTEITKNLKLKYNNSIVTLSADLKNEKIKNNSQIGYAFLTMTIIH